MPRRPAPSFDYAYLAGFQADPDNPNELYLLSPASQKALSALAEIVLWRNTRWYNGSEADIIALSGQIYEELNVPAHLDDLIPYVDDIETLLAEIRDRETCCNTIDSVPGGDGIGGVDDSTLPPDIDRDGEDFPDGWTGGATTFDPYLCGQAQRVAATTDEAIDAVHNAILAASNILVLATLVVLAFGNIFGMAIAAILAGGYTLVTWSEIVGYYSFFTELREALGLEDPDGIVPQTKSEMSSVSDDIERAVYCANDAAEATADLHALIDATVSNSAYAALLKLTYTIAMRPIFWGLGGAPDGTGCDCTVSPDEVWDWGFNNPPTGFALNLANQAGDYIETQVNEGGMYKYLTPPVGDGTMRITCTASYRTSTTTTCTWRIEARDGSDLNGTVLDYAEFTEPGDLSVNDRDETLDISGRSGSTVTLRFRQVAGGVSPAYAMRWYDGALYW